MSSADVVRLLRERVRSGASSISDLVTANRLMQRGVAPILALRLACSRPLVRTSVGIPS